MTTSLTEYLNNIFHRIPVLASYRPEEFEITELISHSNKNFRLKNHNLDVILRIPRTETSKYINRKAEIKNENIAFTLGLSPLCLWQSEQGESLTQTVPNCKTLTPSDLKKKNIIHLLAINLQQLHRCKHTFQGQVNLPELLSQFFGLMNKQQQNHFKERLEQALFLVKTLEPGQESPVPSHNDLNEKNLLLDNNNKLWMIDWEYSSMASPYWDLATICNAGQYQQSHSRYLLDCYCTPQNSLELDNLTKYRGVLSLLNDCWMEVFSTKR